jgi:hypothetical protein
MEVGNVVNRNRRPRVRLDGLGQNKFAILKACIVAAKEVDWPEERIEVFATYAVNGDFEHLIAVIKEHFDVAG